MATILPTTKATTETPIAKSDDHHDALVADSTVSQFPQGSSFGNVPTPTTSSTSSATAFGSAPSTGFGSTSGFGSSTSSSFGGGGFGSSSSTPAFGGSSGGFGGGMGSNQMGSTGTANMNMSMGNQPVLSGAGANAAQDADVLVKNTNEDWINKKWRPVMGWMYMVVCMCDFVMFPIMWSLLQALSHGQVTSQWQPVTLQGAGLFHVAMGAVLGIAAYGRTQEKLGGAAGTSGFGK